MRMTRILLAPALALVLGCVLAACNFDRSGEDPLFVGDILPGLADAGPPAADAARLLPDGAPRPVLDSGTPGQPPPPPAAAYWDGPFGTADRPVDVRVPAGYDPAKSAPLVVLLHGYSAWGMAQDLYLGMSDIADREGFLFVAPDGLVDPLFSHYWNATDACCDIFGSGVDDVAYLRHIIDQVEAAFSVDPRRVYVVGHSNGGFMANRLGCDLADRVAAIAALAGAQWEDAGRCQPSTAVSVLEIHGTLDTVIFFGGGRLPHSNFKLIEYPDADETAAIWASKNGCQPEPESLSQRLDLDAVVPGAETSLRRYRGCRPHGEVEQWTMHGSGHVPLFRPAFVDEVYRFLLAHPKP